MGACLSKPASVGDANDDLPVANTLLDRVVRVSKIVCNSTAEHMMKFKQTIQEHVRHTAADVLFDPYIFHCISRHLSHADLQVCLL